MSRLFIFQSASRPNAEVDAWFAGRGDELTAIAHRWFTELRNCSDEVNELMHDGYPTACLGQAAFAYVGVFKAHVNLGFFHGAELDDPAGMLEGSGKFMRHVKLRPNRPVDEPALEALVQEAYLDMRYRLRREEE